MGCGEQEGIKRDNSGQFGHQNPGKSPGLVSLCGIRPKVVYHRGMAAIGFENGRDGDVAEELVLASTNGTDAASNRC